MARLGKPVEVPDFGSDWQAEDAWYEEYRKGKRILNFPVADGHASYEVSGVLTLRHIPVGDRWQIPYAHIRGLRKQDIEAHLERDRWMQELFSKK